MIDGFRPVTKRAPCEVCGKTGWCMISDDGDKQLCARTISTREMGEAGWIHILREGANPSFVQKARSVVVPTGPPKAFNWPKLALELEESLYDILLDSHAKSLGVNTESLDSLNIGWSDTRKAFSFPMRNHNGTVVGIRYRNIYAQKWAHPGSQAGLFFDIDKAVPHENGKTDWIIICEGPTDTAAVLSLGLCAVGRPSCSGGFKYLRHLCRGKKVVIIADKDGPGLMGARQLGDKMINSCSMVKLIEPLGGKDAREWICEYGATLESIARLECAMNPHRRGE